MNAIVVWHSIYSFNIDGNSDDVRLPVGVEKFPVVIECPLVGKK